MIFRRRDEKEEQTPVKTVFASSSARPVIGVLGAKGGVGSTTLAVNLTAAFGSGPNTLIDANLQAPDAALLLAQQPQFTLMELVSRAGQIEKQIFDACCTPFSGNREAVLLSPPLDGQAGAAINLTALAECLPAIRQFSARVVIDLPRTLDRHFVTVLDHCDIVLLVMEANLTSLAGAQRWLSIFNDLGYAHEKCLLVLNRHGGKLKYVEEQVLAKLQRKDLLTIANSYAAAEECGIAGEPIVCRYPRDAYSRAVKQIANIIDARIASACELAPDMVSPEQAYSSNAAEAM